ncbi:MAG: glycerophosphodiester phosphodiesterase [Provencibacterium sp.]|jgi:glycerophosphoryl diester phosphodiesterase|nr:glycerophosphodiester phosphodiesterase [Provencibacterium sp.]
MPLNIAHRGFSGRYPENTMLAFTEAEKAGCDGIELDVHLTRDGIPVVIHDEDIRRTTDGSGPVGSFTAGELRAFNAAAAWKGEHPAQTIPTLEEYLDWAAGTRLFTNIELKNSVVEYPELEAKAVALVRRYGLEGRILFSSFNHPSILRCKRLAPEIRCGFLCDCWLAGAGAYTSGHGVECLHPQYRSLTGEAVEEIRRHAVAVNTWTVNEEADMRRLADAGIEGLITNYPDRLHALLA